MANIKHSQLTAGKVKSLNAPGTYADGEGLTLRVSDSGAKSWVLRATIGGKRKNIGLGGFPSVGLAEARRLAEKHRQVVRDGIDPVELKREAREASKPESTIPTFRQATVELHKQKVARFKSEKHGKNWIQRVEKYAFPTIGDKPLDQIDRLEVLNILTPIWTTKSETARRVRQRMRSVFAWGMAFGYIATNPAGESIDAALVSMPKFTAHLRALPYRELPAALKTIRDSQSVKASKLALEFLALTASRSGEVRGATWSEIDWESALWVIPAERMKAGAEHRVPLTDGALAILQEAWAIRDEGGLVFPSPVKKGHPLSDMTLTKILRKAGLADRMTVHGIRSSFRDWVAEQTATPWAVAEVALAHKVGNSVEQAYHRTDYIEQCRPLMQEWANFLAKVEG